MTRLTKCMYPDWEGDYTEGGHVGGSDGTCAICGEPLSVQKRDGVAELGPETLRADIEKLIDGDGDASHAATAPLDSHDKMESAGAPGVTGTKPAMR